MKGFITGDWSGIPNLLLTCIFGLLTIGVGAYLADRYGKKYAPLVMVGIMVGIQIMVSFTSSKFVTLTVAGKEFFIIAGSLMFPILALGDDYLNEFYGRAVAKSSVIAQFITRALTTIFLVWLIFLPEPSFKPGNFEMFKNLMGIVPRVAISSIIATYIGGIANVHIFDKVRQKTEGRLLWLRTLVSTVMGLFINAVVFTFLAFAFTVPARALGEMIIISMVVRIITGLLEIVFLYMMYGLKNKGLILKDHEPLVLGPKEDEQAVSKA